MPTSRRTFAKNATLAVAGLPLVAADLAAQTTPAPPANAKKAGEEEKIVPASSLGRALAEVVFAQSGEFLTADDLITVERDMQDNAGAYKRLREFKLANSDEPDFTFASLTKRW